MGVTLYDDIAKKRKEREEGFRQFIYELEKKWIGIVCVLGFTLVPIFGILDYFIIPPEYLEENLTLFWALRAGASVITLIQFFIIRFSPPNKWNALHAYFFTFLVCGIISYMTTRLGGFESSYYAGNNLVLIAVNLFLPWNARKGLLNGLIMLTQYLVLNFLTDPDFQVISILNNVYFMGGTLIIAVTIAHFKFILTQAEYNKINEIQDLKTQQDGDYFLTYLITKPLAQNRAESNSVKIEFLVEQKKKFQFKRWDEALGGDVCISHSIELQGRPYTLFINADAMGKSMQGAGGVLVLGAVLHAMVERTKLSPEFQDVFPERWLKNALIEFQKTFESFDGSMMISCLIGMVDDLHGIMYYINSEHPFPVLLRDGKATFFGEDRVIRKIGMMGLEGTISIGTLVLEHDDIVILGSDGRDDIVMEIDGELAMNTDDDLFLSYVEEFKGDLTQITEKIKSSGMVVDDISLLKLQFQDEHAELRPRPLTPEIEEILERKSELLRDRDANGALEALEHAYSLDTNQPTITKQLVALHYRLGNYERATELVIEYCAMQPGDSYFLFVASRCLKRVKDYRRAADFGERFRLRDPMNVPNLINLVDVYRLADNKKRASDLLDEVERQKPDYKHALRLRELLEKN